MSTNSRCPILCNSIHRNVDIEHTPKGPSPETWSSVKPLMDCTFRPQDWFIKSRQIGSTIFLLTMLDFGVSLV